MEERMLWGLRHRGYSYKCTQFLQHPLRKEMRVVTFTVIHSSLDVPAPGL
jgi:hypothetical protein